MAQPFQHTAVPSSLYPIAACMHLVDGPIDAEAFRRALSGEAAASGCGAVAEFVGMVRADLVDAKGTTADEQPHTQAVDAIVYEAYAPMAERILAELEHKIQKANGAVLCRIRHSVGEVPAGSASMWIGVAAVHRVEAFEALRSAVERVKVEAPVWKWERFAGGENGQQALASGTPEAAPHKTAARQAADRRSAGRWVPGPQSPSSF